MINEKMKTQNKQENVRKHLALRRSHAFESINFKNGMVYLNRDNELALRRSRAFKSIDFKNGMVYLNRNTMQNII